MRISAQPDETTCGPTALHALYVHYGDPLPLEQVVEEVPSLDEGGTLDAMLASHALRRGYEAIMYTYNLRVFDPTWFARSGVDLPAKLRAQTHVKPYPKLRIAVDAYLEFLTLGGEVRFEDVTEALLRRHLDAGEPILAGVCATYLYRCAREVSATSEYDDVRGELSGHFILVTGVDAEGKNVSIADPLANNPAAFGPRYTVPMERLLGAIFLGVQTYDGNLLVVRPRARRQEAR